MVSWRCKSWLIKGCLLQQKPRNSHFVHINAEWMSDGCLKLMKTSIYSWQSRPSCSASCPENPTPETLTSTHPSQKRGDNSHGKRSHRGHQRNQEGNGEDNDGGRPHSNVRVQWRDWYDATGGAPEWHQACHRERRCPFLLHAHHCEGRENLYYFSSTSLCSHCEYRENLLLSYMAIVVKVGRIYITSLSHSPTYPSLWR